MQTSVVERPRDELEEHSLSIGTRCESEAYDFRLGPRDHVRVLSLLKSKESDLKENLARARVMKIRGESSHQPEYGTLFGVDESGSQDCLAPVEVVGVGGPDVG